MNEFRGFRATSGDELVGKAITVYSPKGGVGKSTIALALAGVLSRKNKVVVVEVDFSPGDMAATLEVDLKNIFLQEGGIDLSIQRPPQEGFDVLTGGFPDAAEMVSHEAVLSVVADLRERYDYVVIDTQSYLTESVVAALRAADLLLLVTEDSIASVSRTLGMMDYLQGNAFADLSRAALIVNRMSAVFRPTVTEKYIGAAGFSLPVVARIPEFKSFGGYKDAKIATVMAALAKGSGLN